MKVRITNNKNIQTMEQKDIDIYEILKGEEYGTELYTPKCGRVWHSGMANDKDSAKAIWTEDEAGREHFFDKNGKIYKEGEILLFPSKEMRDWSKFFKKGDVLEYKGENNCKGTCIFESYEDEMTKLDFTGLYILQKGKIRNNPTSFRTSDWVKSDDPAGYIKTVEEQLGGKLNLETLEIEKKPAFEIGKLYVFDEEDEDGKVTVIGKLIGKEEGELTIGNQYEIENENFVTNETFFLNISLHKELREATEGEIELFNKHCAIWEKKEKEAMEQPDFKPFDKVLVRNGGKCKWLPAFFVRDRGEDFAWRYKVLPIHNGRTSDFASCIPYEGNENIAFTSDPF
ncbi:hypothetical protein [Prevotella sp.]|uniref:hypothetical protein n=1 Tax=Prevotella sp. TaxID=59823 RepID=UPI0027E2E4CA|nr:hypothetical protein [Prevotella sp.]